jgi:hypothetical protein
MKHKNPQYLTKRNQTYLYNALKFLAQPKPIENGDDAVNALQIYVFKTLENVTEISLELLSLMVVSGHPAIVKKAIELSKESVVVTKSDWSLFLKTTPYKDIIKLLKRKKVSPKNGEICVLSRIHTDGELMPLLLHLAQTSRTSYKLLHEKNRKFISLKNVLPYAEIFLSHNVKSFEETYKNLGFNFASEGDIEGVYLTLVCGLDSDMIKGHTGRHHINVQPFFPPNMSAHDILARHKETQKFSKDLTSFFLNANYFKAWVKKQK